MSGDALRIIVWGSDAGSGKKKEHTADGEEATVKEWTVSSDSDAVQTKIIMVSSGFGERAHKAGGNALNLAA